MKKTTIKVIAGSMLLCTMANAFADPVTDRIFASHQVNLGVRSSSAPMSYKLPDGQYVGMAVDICNSVVDELKKKDPSLKVNYVEVTSDNRIPYVQQGKIDMECGSTTNSGTRRKQVNFSIPYYVAGIAVVTLRKDNMNTITDLKNGDRVVFTKGTTTDKSIFKTYKGVKLDWDSKNIKFNEGKDHQDSFNQLSEGKAKLFANDDILVMGLVANSKDPSAYKILPERFSIEPYGIMVSKDATDLQALVDSNIINLMKKFPSDPNSFTSLYNKWFMKPIPPKGNVLNVPMNSFLTDIVREPTSAVGN
ncbi:amino acid ABC transporter substrate-binding protein [Burkholderia contaminans]|uniref:amino acid ABC transporter substrate-binding protein n=1 Tax=Burkholderia contaminans TaxID=488447 RepID=UPI001588A4E4|nr:amino acid ABC transporter substrate-binding protein [Burkholderia contaminans]